MIFFPRRKSMRNKIQIQYMFLFAWISNANEFAIFVIRTDSYFDKF